MNTLYAAGPPIFLAMLAKLSAWLDKAEAHAKAKGYDVQNLLDARLAPDMFSLVNQVQMVTAFAKNAACRLAGQTPPDFSSDEKTLAELRARLARTVEIVTAVKPEAFAEAASREINVRTGPDSSTMMSGQDYLLTFALPNFYFHAATAYDILRHNGVELGKRDFLPSAPL